ncbi:hypothetical protein Q1695_005429 [Nippostrongylus brasiliensis]|nr:hypothetical protein Q1695_005429 [Nippostrongylus brasiliensis]
MLRSRLAGWLLVYDGQWCVLSSSSLTFYVGRPAMSGVSIASFSSVSRSKPSVFVVRPIARLTTSPVQDDDRRAGADEAECGRRNRREFAVDSEQ